MVEPRSFTNEFVLNAPIDPGVLSNVAFEDQNALAADSVDHTRVCDCVSLPVDFQRARARPFTK
jgi:hypothetical protein